jgi:hypothetical protein
LDVALKEELLCPLLSPTPDRSPPLAFHLPEVGNFDSLDLLIRDLVLFGLKRGKTDFSSLMPGYTEEVKNSKFYLSVF